MTVVSFPFAASVLALLGVFAAPLASAQDALPASPQNATPARASYDVVYSHSNLSAGLPDGESVDFRGTWALEGGDVLQAEILDERKFGDHGGVAGLSYTAVFSPDWYGTGTLVGGVGGPNWANNRVDLQLSRKWLPSRQLVTSAALYRAAFDNNRNDTGARLSAAWYLDAPLVLEAGVILNISQPGRIHSHMPYVSATIGREGSQYFSLRASRGTEAYQALGDIAQLVNFSSRSLSANWKLWLGQRWGLNAQAEYYNNPTYHRSTLGAGVFVQW